MSYGVEPRTDQSAPRKFSDNMQGTRRTGRVAGIFSANSCSDLFFPIILLSRGEAPSIA